MDAAAPHVVPHLGLQLPCGCPRRDVLAPFRRRQLAGLALPPNRNLFIRARGYYATGLDNGSASVVESVRNVYLTRHTIYLPLVLR